MHRLHKALSWVVLLPLVPELGWVSNVIELQASTCDMRWLTCSRALHRLLLVSDQAKAYVQVPKSATHFVARIHFGTYAFSHKPLVSCLQGDSHTEAFRCIEMQEQREWLYGVDAYGIAAVAHCLLFGDYMAVEKATDAAGAVPLSVPVSVCCAARC